MNDKKRKHKIIGILLVMMLFPWHTVKAEAAGQAYSQELSRYAYLNYYKAGNADRYVKYKEKHPDDPWLNVITYVNIGLDNDFYTNISTVGAPGKTDVLVNKYNALSASYVPEGLETISAKFSKGYFQLRADARQAFEKMCADAAGLGLDIKAVSAYRSYRTQDTVYFSKIKKRNAAEMEIRDKVSARAGHSEHQLGLAIDVIGTDLWVQNTKEFAWYSRNAHKYGFIIRYQEGRESITGYAYEPWHLRYLGIELASAVFGSGLTYDEYYANFIDIEEKEKEKEKVITVSQKEQIIFVDSKRFKLDAFDDGSTRHYKIQDMVHMLNGTQKEFQVFWDSKNETLNFHTYTGQTGAIHDTLDKEAPTAASEKPVEGKSEGITARLPAIKTYIDGREECLTYLDIDGHYYLSLEDLAKILDFSPTVDNFSGYLEIRTNKAQNTNGTAL